MKRLIFIVTIGLFMYACGGGYSFTGGSVGEAKTISVDYFANQALQVNPDLSQRLTEQIKTTFIQQTPLDLTTDQADLLVEGSITDYNVRPMSAQGNETTSQSRFTITIRVTFTNNVEADKSYQETFSRYRDFSSDNLFSDVENELMEEINKELAEDIMNRAIANW